MSETLERRRERLAGLEARDWIRGKCANCGTLAFSAPGSNVEVLCMECRRARCGIDWPWFSRVGVWHPGIAFGEALRAAERAAQGCPVCATAQTVATCTYAGHVPPVAPELVCEQPCVHVEPAPMTALLQDALRFGWKAQVQHSRGTPAGARAVAEMWSVRFRRGTWAGYAVRRGDAWKSVCVTGAALPPFLALGATELREWLADPDACGPAWCDAIRAKVARAALHAKQVACPGAPLCVPVGPWTVDGVGPARLDHTHRGDGGIVKKVSRKEAAGAL